MTVIDSRGTRVGILVLLIILAAGVAPVAAQTSVAVVGGVNMATLTLPLEDVSFGEIVFSKGWRAGATAGVVFDVPIDRTLALEIGALYSEKGATADISIPDFGSASASFRISYLDVPTLAKVGVARYTGGRLFLLAGATSGLKLSARAKASAMGVSASEDISDSLPAMDFGLTIGARFEARHALGEVRYTHGLRNLSDSEIESVKTRTISFLGGWRF